jgi:hypothetical protein
MPPIPLDIPPGIVKTKSANAAKGRFTDCDKCRFINGLPEKWRGQQSLLDDALLGKARGATSWVNEFGNANIAIGTHLKLYAVEGGDALVDITPARSSGTLGTDPFAVVINDATVTVTHTAHGADVDDFVTYGGATAGGGITINGEYQITSIIDDDHYTIEHSAQATSTDSTTGGAAVTFEYQIHVGLADAAAGLGFGAGDFGSGTYGTERAEGIPLELRVWSLDPYGHDLLASPLNGGLYLWEEATDARAEVVSGAPTDIRYMFVTPERFIFALCANKRIRWPDRDDPTDWTPTLTNTANERTMQKGSRLMAGAGLEGLSLVWTDTACYVFQYDGSDLVYTDRLAGTGGGLVAQKAFCEVGGTAFWMSTRSFQMYQGGMAPIPNADDILGFVFGDDDDEGNSIDTNFIAKTWCEYDPYNGQVRWHYVSRNSPNGEPDRYVDVNIGGDWAWTVGTRDATTGTIFRQQDSSMITVDSSGIIQNQNEGHDLNDDAMAFSLTWGLYSPDNGNSALDVIGIIPDCERHVGQLDFRVFTKEYPNSTAVQDEATGSFSPGDGRADIKVFGKYLSMTATSDVLGGDVRFGICKLDTPDRLAGTRP